MCFTDGKEFCICVVWILQVVINQNFFFFFWLKICGALEQLGRTERWLFCISFGIKKKSLVLWALASCGTHRGFRALLTLVLWSPTSCFELGEAGAHFHLLFYLHGAGWCLVVVWINLKKSPRSCSPLALGCSGCARCSWSSHPSRAVNKVMPQLSGGAAFLQVANPSLLL